MWARTLTAVLLLSTAAPQEGERVELFNGRDLEGWVALGDASYTVDGDSILGETTRGGHSFLVSEREFGDFVLEVDVKTEEPGNSGIQIRSHVDDKGRIYGYQIEIDPSERAWSGGLYDEGRRGWLQNLEGRDEARAAFQYGEWNAYRIECRGPWIRTWINGVPITDTLDPLDASGVFGLQVHSGNNTRVRWRGLELTDFGRHVWVPVGDEGPALLPRLSGVARAWRWAFDAGGEGGVLVFGEAPETWKGAERLAPGVLEKDGAWGVGVQGDSTIELPGEGLVSVAVCVIDNRLNVFVDGKPVAQVSDRTLPRKGTRFFAGNDSTKLEALVPEL